MKIAIIGSGISGSLCARLLHQQHDIHLFEADHRPGGHTNTVMVEAFGGRYPVDTGFMVYNDRTYPNFSRLLKILGVATQASDMSLSVRCERTGLEYQGSSLNGIFAQRANLVRPAFYRMLGEIVRFNRESTRWIEDYRDDAITLREYLACNQYGAMFIDKYLLPMTAAIWSAPPDTLLDFPAMFLLQFLHNHGLLQINDRPQWKTIFGGARQYLQALTQPFRNAIRLETPVVQVRRKHDYVEVTSAREDVGWHDTEGFDQVIFATHADQTLRLLVDATSAEREILSAFPYQTNEAILHTDESLLPRRRRAWASWNYHIRNPQFNAGNGHSRNSAAATGLPGVAVTYDVNRLQRLGAPRPICVTLNHANWIDPAKIVRRFNYSHPVFGVASIAARKRHAEISGAALSGRTHFCGAYWGYGFHEDGVNSALAVGQYFGVDLDSCRVACTQDMSSIAVTAQ